MKRWQLLTVILVIIAIVLIAVIVYFAGMGTGDLIAFQSNRNGQSDIFTIRPDGTNLQNVTQGQGGGINTVPKWSP